MWLYRLYFCCASFSNFLCLIEIYADNKHSIQALINTHWFNFPLWSTCSYCPLKVREFLSNNQYFCFNVNIIIHWRHLGFFLILLHHLLNVNHTTYLAVGLNQYDCVLEGSQAHLSLNIVLIWHQPLLV